MTDQVKDHWINKLTKEALEDLHKVYHEAREVFRGIYAESKEENEIKGLILQLGAKVEGFYKDLNGLSTSSESRRVGLIEETRKNLATCTEEINRVKDKIHEFKKLEEKDLKISDIMERDIVYFERLLSKVKELLRL